MKELKLSPPWNTFVSELNALFGEDHDIKIVYNDEDMEVKLFVADSEKADALTQLLPAQRVYGNVVFTVTVVPANSDECSESDLIRKAFKGNPVLSSVEDVKTPFGSFSYAVFRKTVVQFYNDDISDINGNKSTLYADIARDVFGEGSVFFCTDTKDAN